MIHILVAARTSSTRLPNKHFLKLGKLSVIEHVVRRCEHFGFKPFICVPKGDEDAFNEHTSCIDVFGGDPDNVEARLMECAIENKIDIFHQLDGDDPFFSREMVVESMQCFLRGRFSRILPSVASQSGLALCGTSYNLKAQKDWTQETLPDPATCVWPQRLTLDYEEDYQLLCAVNRMVGGYVAPRWAVDDLFVRNPDLHKINWFRNEEWKDKQFHERPRINL